jgi:hypothetical protein
MRRSSVRFRQAAPPEPPGQDPVSSTGGFFIPSRVAWFVARGCLPCAAWLRVMARRSASPATMRRCRRGLSRVTDSFYSELRRCREHCNGRPQVQHRTTHRHNCDERCRPHVCKPLNESSILYIHQILSGAFRRAVRLKWVSVNRGTSAPDIRSGHFASGRSAAACSRAAMTETARMAALKTIKADRLLIRCVAAVSRTGGRPSPT